MLIGGDKMMIHLANIAKKMQGEVSVGFMADALYPDGTPVAQVAFYNEFGTSRIPPRPFFRGMIAKNSPGWAMRMSKAAAYYDFDGQKVLELMGQTIQEKLQEAIVDFSDPANAPSTIEKKGFDKPLIDTGHMKDSVTFKVKDAE